MPWKIVFAHFILFLFIFSIYFTLQAIYNILQIWRYQITRINGEGQDIVKLITCPLIKNYSFILREVQFWENFGSPHRTLTLAQIKAASLQNFECWNNTKSLHISFDINRAFSANIQQNLTP